MKQFAKKSAEYYEKVRRKSNKHNAAVYFGKRLDLIEKNLNFNGNKLKFLDIGCGDGTFLSMIQKKCLNLSLYGIDLSRTQIAVAKKRIRGVGLRVGDAAKLPYKSDFFDIIFINALLHHVTDIPMVIAEAVRVCRSGGSIIIVEPNRLNPGIFIMSLLKKHERGTLRLKPETLKDQLLSQNTSSIKFFRLNSILFPFQSFPGKKFFKFFYWLENFSKFPSILKSHFVYIVQIKNKKK